MNLYTIEGNLLYTSTHKSLGATIEYAIDNNVTLEKIDLSNKDLRNITFDTATMRGASFKNANLTGANISECALDFSDFSHATLYDTCLVYSSLKGVSFLYSLFGATDLSETIIDNSLFSGPTTFSLSFRSVTSMMNVKYFQESMVCSMQTPPIHIKGNHCDTTILDDHIIIDNQIFANEYLEEEPQSHLFKNHPDILYKKLIRNRNGAEQI